jgi:hypothetical protein
VESKREVAGSPTSDGEVLNETPRSAAAFGWIYAGLHRTRSVAEGRIERSAELLAIDDNDEHAGSWRDTTYYEDAIC